MRKYKNYQDVFGVEIMSNDRGIWRDFRSIEIADLQAELFQRVILLAKTHLTPRQWQIFELKMQGLCDAYIGEILGIYQQGVWAQWNGLIWHDPKTPQYKGRKYGGVLKKLKLLTSTDPQCQEILQQIAEQKAKEAEENY
jgi:hypothetical protein